MSEKIRKALIDYSRITGKADEALQDWETLTQAIKTINKVARGDEWDPPEVYEALDVLKRFEEGAS